MAGCSGFQRSIKAMVPRFHRHPRHMVLMSQAASRSEFSA